MPKRSAVASSESAVVRPRADAPDPLDDVTILSLEELRARDSAQDMPHYPRCAQWFANNAPQFNSKTRWIDIDGPRPHMCISIRALVEDAVVGDATLRATLDAIVDTLRVIAFERAYNLHFRVFDTPNCRIEVYRKVPKKKK